MRRHCCRGFRSRHLSFELLSVPRLGSVPRSPPQTPSLAPSHSQRAWHCSDTPTTATGTHSTTATSTTPSCHVTPRKRVVRQFQQIRRALSGLRLRCFQQIREALWPCLFLSLSLGLSSSSSWLKPVSLEPGCRPLWARGVWSAAHAVCVCAGVQPATVIQSNAVEGSPRWPSPCLSSLLAPAWRPLPEEGQGPHQGAEDAELSLVVESSCCLSMAPSKALSTTAPKSFESGVALCGRMQSLNHSYDLLLRPHVCANRKYACVDVRASVRSVLVSPLAFPGSSLSCLGPAFGPCGRTVTV